MSTSLAEQLQRLALPQTTLLKRDKKRPSLLFDPKEAANLDKETVYQIGIDGLEELKERNAVFAQFETTIFHITSKEFERSVETAEANQRLDKTIRKFLLLLSPYFLFNCSYKALEWLVYRYYIHEYNKEDLLMLILPHHETNIFVRVLQLLNLKQPNDKWGWLKPLQKPGIHLPKQTLYNHAASDVYFLELLSNFILTIIKEHDNPSSLTVIFNFYCTTFTGALEYTHDIREAQVSQMLPVLLRGLTSDIPDFAASSYVICATLLTKTQLSDKILEKFIEKISNVNVPTLKTEAVMVLIVLYQSQKQFSKMPDVAVRNLSNGEGMAKILEQFNSENVHIYPLLHPLLQSGIHYTLVKEDNEAYQVFVDSVIAEVKIEDAFVEPLVSAVLEIYHPKVKYPESRVTWLKDLLQRIERQHPVAYDSSVKNIMKPTEDPLRKQNQKILRKLLGDVTNMQGSYELFEKLYHPNSKIRVEGLRILGKRLKVFKGKDMVMFQNALFDRINDDSLEVVVETLRLFKLKFPQVVDMQGLKDLLIKLLAKCQSDKGNWWKASCAALDVMCYHFRDSDFKVFLATLPFLMPTSEGEMRAAKQVVKSEYMKRSKILGWLKEELDQVTSSDQFSMLVYNSLNKSKHLPDVKVLVEALKDMPERNAEALHKYLAMLLLGGCLPENSDAGVSRLVLDIFETYLGLSKVTVVKEEVKVTDYIMLARNNKLTLQSFLQCVENLIGKTQVAELGLADFSLDNDLTRFYLGLVKLLMKGAGSRKLEKAKAYSSTLKVFLRRFCGDKLLSTVSFCLNTATAENEWVNDDLRLTCIKTAISELNDAQRKFGDLLDVQNAVVPFILVGLNLPSEEVRRLLLDLIRLLTKGLNADSKNYVKLLTHLKKHHEEILMDHEQMPLVMFNIFSDGSLKRSLASLIDSLSNPKYPIYLKAGLMTLLSHINDINIYTKTSELALEVLSKKESTRGLSTSESEIIHKNIIRLDSSIAGDLSTDSSVWQLVELNIKNDSDSVQCNQSKPTCQAVLLLNQVDRNIFQHLKRPVQVALLDLIIEAATASQSPEVLQAASHVFKRIDLDTSLVLEQLQRMRDVRSPKQDPAKRKRRIGVIPTVDILDTNEWKKGVTVLEFIQDKKKIRNTTILLSVLFEILKKCLDFDEQASVEYPKQLLLSTILHCCNKIDDEPLPENAFNMQLVVQCIRASQNPQTHHHALLLLAQAASLIPKEVLHHIIAIFTFMGSSVLRHDDAYSFQIISKIIDTIIPILIQDSSDENVATVLRVFVDAILDIPEHRRMPLFTQLLTRLNPKENLHVFLLIIFEAHVVHGHTEKQRSNKRRSLINVDDVPKRLDIAADLSREFSAEVVIVTCIKVLQYLSELPEEKDDDTENAECYTFDIKRYSAKQFRHYKYTIILFIANLLSSPQFVMKVAALSDEEMLQLEGVFKDMIIHVLNYVQQTSKVADRSANGQQAHYWKVMLHHSYDTLDAINALLTNQMFLLVIRGLMVYSLSTVRKRALELLNNKLQYTPAFANECDKSELYNVIISPLINIIKTIDKPNVEPEQEHIVQRALISLKLLVKHLAPENPEKFVQILDFIADLVKTGVGKIHENVFASLITCLAELCSTLRAHAIASLGKFMPVLIKLLKSQKRLDTPNLLLTTDIAVIHKILESLPLFLSPYLEKLLYEISLLACNKWSVQADDQKLVPFVTKLQNIQQKIGSIIPLRVLLPAVENSYNRLVEKRNFIAIAPLMTVLSENLNNLTGSDIQGNLAELTNFFLNALQFRVDARSTHQEADEVEAHIVKTFVTLILKLSESTFRPLYYKLFDWAVRTDAKTERVITFYNLSSAFASCLKGLFVLFAGHFLNNAATLLDACNQIKSDEMYFEDDDKNIALLENILKTLHAIFMYDSQKFMTKERFDVLMQPIVDQLENTLGGIESLEKRTKTILTPCIVQFAVAIADDALWKQMNYQILLKTRHNSPNIRLVTLECLSETAKKLGEDFLPLLPETIPFLAELLEDEEETVEKASQRAVQELEKVLGEPLQKYF